MACLPHYRSLMSYGWSEHRFSDLEGYQQINAARMAESDPFGASFPYSRLADSPWNYEVYLNNVDWNRNGFAGDYYGGPPLFRTPAISAFWSSCDAFIQGNVSLAATTDIRGAVDLVRAGTRLYAFWATGAGIMYKFASLGAAGNKSCTGSADPTVPPACLTWGSTRRLASGATFKGVSALTFDDQLFVATNTTSNALVIRRYAIGGSGTVSLVGSPWTFDNDMEDRSAFGPELVELHRGGQPVMAMLYLSETGTFWQRRWDWGAWSSAEPLLDQSGQEIPGGEGPAADGWPDATLGWAASERQTFALLPAANRILRVYQLLHTSGYWVLRHTTPVSTYGKPSLEFRPIRTSDGFYWFNGAVEYQGHFVIAWLDKENRAIIQLSAPYDRNSPPGYGFSLISAGVLWAGGSERVLLYGLDHRQPVRPARQA